MDNNITNNQIVEHVEQELISEILSDISVAEDAVLKLEPADFANKQMAAIFNVIIALHEEGKSIDEHTITSYIQAHNELQFDDYALVIKTLSHKFVSVADADDHIELIKNASIKRQINSFAEEMIETNMDPIQFDELLWNLQTRFSSIVSSKHTSKIATMSEITKQYVQHLGKIMNHEESISGTPTGFSMIDSKTNGLQPGEMIVLAARPSVGKTALALNFLLNAARDIKERADKQPNSEIVLMFSLEMSSEQLCNRLVSCMSMVELSPYHRSRLSQVDYQAVMNAIDELSALPIYIDDDGSLSIMDIQAKVKQISLHHRIKLLVIDYLGLIKGSKVQGGSYNRQQEIAQFSGKLKEIAKAYKLPVLVLAQLNRKMDERGKSGNAKPLL
ncbi:MAG: AAA family ATPase, partial [Mycoplasmataceae bacterium]|nr:AAA family ATPase [Mycoplasmataceae bacterium]